MYTNNNPGPMYVYPYVNTHYSLKLYNNNYYYITIIGN